MAAEADGGMTQRDLLLEVRADVKAMRNELGQKADRQTVSALQTQVNVLSERLIAVEGDIKTITEVRSGNRAVIATVLTLIAVLITVGGFLVQVASR